jgi:23S rRNA 5-hydroxycytidine C2501 synthase
LNKPLELVAPAGNADIGIAAIDHGADAVYIGAPKFSARAQACNSIDEIARLVRYAHLYYARVYMALNTILTNEELPQALEIIKQGYDAGIDALIIQDVGLLEMELPPVPLIASTQMHNDTIEKVQFLEAAGFKRAILARELFLEQIRSIRQQTGIELEFFVHGAICVSYSGQCYLSQAAAGRSGNRGVCAQPCRYRYDLVDGNGNIIVQNKYLLSLKDLNLSDAIADLAAAGITSFKIEGRYKEIDYVKNITASYRQALDKFIKENPNYRKSSSGKCEFMFTPDTTKTFNRGYTKNYIYNNNEKTASIYTQKSIGQPIGIVTEVNRNFFKTDCNDIKNGDGLCFFTSNNELDGFRVNRVEHGRIYPNKMEGLESGTSLYRNYDIEFEKQLKKLSSLRKIEVRMDFRQQDNCICLATADEDGNLAEKCIDVPFEPAKEPTKVLEQIKKQLLKTGDTIYSVKELNVSPSQPGFIVLSVLNSIRRDCLNELTKIRIEKYHVPKSTFTANNTQYPVKTLDFRANVLNEKARQFYKRHGAEIVENAFETLTKISGKQVMISKYCIRRQLNACLKNTQPELDIHGPLRIRDERYSYLLEFDCKNCQMKLIFEGRYTLE